MQKMMGLVRRCIEDYNMIEAGDRVAVGVSGGKDSIFLCSGILNEREAAVRQAIEQAGLSVTESRHKDEWCCLLARCTDADAR